MSITLKQIGEYYDVEKFNDRHDNNKTKYGIWDKSVGTGVYSPKKYYCHLSKTDDGKFYVEGFKDGLSTLPTNNIDQLLQDIKKYVSLLRFNSEYYCPQFVDGHFEYMCLKDYIKSIGFEREFMCEGFVQSRKNVYGKPVEMHFDVLGLDISNFKETQTAHIIYHISAGSLVKIPCDKSIDELIAAVNSLVAPLLIEDMVSSYKAYQTFMEKSKLILSKNDIIGVDIDQNAQRPEDYIKETPMKETIKRQLKELLDLME